MIHVFQPSLGAEELEAVRRVFESNWVGKGAVTDRFEAAFARHLAVDRGCVRSLSSCTEGLFQAMTLLGIAAGDEVVLPSISFVGAANAVLAAGATPVFCDVDRRTLNTTAADLEQAMTRRTRAVILLHYGGVPCDMEPILSLLSARGVPLVEDSACSVASTYRGRACGTFGDVGVWSFDAMKILVTGDGGMIYCRSEEMAARVSRLLYLGLRVESGFSSDDRERWWELDVIEPARRAIMNDIAAAIGVEQLKKMPAFIEHRRRVHARYDAVLGSIGWLEVPPPLDEGVESSYYFYWIQLRAGLRDRLARHLRDRGIYTTFRYTPLHRVSVYGSPTRLPDAEHVVETTLCIPIHHALSDADVDTVLDAIAEFGRGL
jgi:aminotransferase